MRYDTLSGYVIGRTSICRVVLYVWLAAFIGKALAEPYTEINYKRLASPAFQNEYANRYVSFDAVFIGEDTSGLQLYAMKGANVDNMVFLNHRAIDYQSGQTPFGTTDIMPPAFALSLPKDKSDIVFELKRGDVIQIKGLAVKYHKTQQGFDMGGGLQVIADVIVYKGSGVPTETGSSIGITSAVIPSGTNPPSRTTLGAPSEVPTSEPSITAPPAGSPASGASAHRQLSTVQSPQPSVRSGPADDLLKDIQVTPP